MAIDNSHTLDWTGHKAERIVKYQDTELLVLAAARYIELNPVRAHLVDNPRDYPWSSAKAHLLSQDDSVVQVKPLLDLAGEWRAFIESVRDEDAYATLRRHELTGRPLGNKFFVEGLESTLGRILSKQKPGPKTPTN